MTASPIRKMGKYELPLHLYPGQLKRMDPEQVAATALAAAALLQQTRTEKISPLTRQVAQLAREHQEQTGHSHLKKIAQRTGLSRNQVHYHLVQARKLRLIERGKGGRMPKPALREIADDHPVLDQYEPLVNKTLRRFTRSYPHLEPSAVEEEIRRTVKRAAELHDPEGKANLTTYMISALKFNLWRQFLDPNSPHERERQQLDHPDFDAEKQSHLGRTDEADEMQLLHRWIVAAQAAHRKADFPITEKQAWAAIFHHGLGLKFGEVATLLGHRNSRHSGPQQLLSAAVPKIKRYLR